MELRSRTHQGLGKNQSSEEFKELRSILSDMGLYDKGMDLQEMRSIMNALEESKNNTETEFDERDMEQAIRESELDFVNSPPNILNSTMNSNHNVFIADHDANNSDSSSSLSSPSSSVVTIQAEVHHALDWSPAIKKSSIADADKQTHSLCKSFHNIVNISHKILQSDNSSFDLIESAPLVCISQETQKSSSVVNSNNQNKNDKNENTNGNKDENNEENNCKHDVENKIENNDEKISDVESCIERNDENDYKNDENENDENNSTHDLEFNNKNNDEDSEPSL